LKAATETHHFLCEIASKVYKGAQPAANGDDAHVHLRDATGWKMKDHGYCGKHEPFVNIEYRDIVIDLLHLRRRREFQYVWNEWMRRLPRAKDGAVADRYEEYLVAFERIGVNNLTPSKEERSEPGRSLDGDDIRQILRNIEAVVELSDLVLKDTKNKGGRHAIQQFTPRRDRALPETPTPAIRKHRTSTSQ